LNYKLGKDLKIKGIENLDGMPDCTIYKTDKIECIQAGGQLNLGGKIGIILHNVDKPEDFDKF